MYCNLAAFTIIFKPDQFINWAGFESRKKLARFSEIKQANEKLI